MACSKFFGDCELCSKACYFYSDMVGNCGCLADLDEAPINLAGVVRPGHRCGRFQEVFCDLEVPSSEGSAGWVIALGIGAGVVGVGLFGCLWYRYQHTLVDFVRDRVARLQDVADAARALWRAIRGPRAPREHLVVDHIELVRRMEEAGGGGDMAGGGFVGGDGDGGGGGGGFVGGGGEDDGRGNDDFGQDQPGIPGDRDGREMEPGDQVWAEVDLVGGGDGEAVLADIPRRRIRTPEAHRPVTRSMTARGRV